MGALRAYTPPPPRVALPPRAPRLPGDHLNLTYRVARPGAVGPS